MDEVITLIKSKAKKRGDRKNKAVAPYFTEGDKRSGRQQMPTLRGGHKFLLFEWVRVT